MKRDHLNELPEGPLNWLQLEANLKKWVWTQQQPDQPQSIAETQETAKLM